ncbi:family 43 glycosylhydrolase [Pelagicoccus sp. NFK12]|uniref:Family 43 glycosylhydrolase n=1 Tax=Pelagicoccus enzymogenes TaxID=2773457 RepID=A0A927F708_9BACT|nr:glycoside hydrolase family 43 protein [Pelagicoccus enzymogenes]MBD5778340.1 family 43 glycosylhydrolase [Pelagicoccus enzymogenes]
MTPTRYRRFLTALTLCTSIGSIALADYPIVSNRYLADPTSVVTKDRVYIYCSNDDESPVEGGYNIPNIVCVSSSDMKNWTDHGIVFDAERDTSWAKKTWAPAAVERDGKFFLYFGNGGANIGVAVGDSPIGPFEDVLGKPLITHGTPGVQPAENMWLFDPGVFIDDDDQAYIYFGGNGDDNVRAAKLHRDMVTLDGEVIKMHAPNFFEAAWVYKIDDTYYFTYSTTPKAEMRIDYMTSKHPTEGFSYAGIVAAQPPLNNNNNHAAEFKFKGKWYHVYHNRIVATEAGIPTGFRRNIALEEFGYDENGAIIPVEYTVNGVEQNGALDPYQRVEGETFAAQSGIETEPSSAGGMNLAHASDGDWVKVVGVDFGEQGAKSLTLNAKAQAQGAEIELRTGSLDGPLLAKAVVSPSDDWKSHSTEVSPLTGIHDLYIRFTGDQNSELKLDWWQFASN